MHVADQRHGLDVVASLRADGVKDRDVLLAGLLHDAGKGDTGLWPRVAYSLGQAYGPWVWSVAGVWPGMGAVASDALRDHAERSAVLAVEARCSPRTVELIRHQDAPTRPRVRRDAEARRRGQLMPSDGVGVPVMAPGIGGRAAATAPTAPTAPAVRFGEGRRPESALQVQVAEFEGPLALLLSLIEARQLDVLTVPLGGLAEAYLDALATLDADRLGNVSSFVAVASQLILIKSRAMLPRRVVLDPTALPDEGPTPRRNCAPGCCSTAPTATPACDSRRRRSGGSACSGASPARPSRRDRRCAARRRPDARSGPARSRAGSPRGHRAAGRPAARGHGPDDHDHRTRRDHPRRPARRADGRPPGPAGRRPRPRRDRDHVPGHARAHEAPRDRRRAGRAVGPDRRPGHDPRPNARRPGSGTSPDDEPLDESLESFA